MTWRWNCESKRNPNFKIWKILIQEWERNEKVCLGENTKGGAKWSFDKKISQSSQQKAGTTVQSNGRLILKAIQRSTGLSLLSRVPSSMSSGQTGFKGGAAGMHGTSAGPAGTISNGRLHFLHLELPRVGLCRPQWRAGTVTTPPEGAGSKLWRCLQCFLCWHTEYTSSAMRARPPLHRFRWVGPLQRALEKAESAQRVQIKKSYLLPWRSAGRRAQPGREAEAKLEEW